MNDEIVKDFLNKKYIKYKENLNFSDSAIFLRLYQNIHLESLKNIFSYIHFELNRLFKILNNRVSNGNFLADPSRDLIYAIEEIKFIKLQLDPSEYAFEINAHYLEKIKECESFLENRNGSKIPENFEKVKLVEIYPIFNFSEVVSVERHNRADSYPVKSIGTGSYSTVYKYKDAFYDSFFALKKAKKDLSEKEYERFRNEFEIMKKLRHPYIAKVYSFNIEKRHYIMEYFDETLDEYISKNNTKLSIIERVDIVFQILKPFIYINNMNIFHRDISTTNILLKKYDSMNIFKVADFGLVKLEGSKMTSKNTDLKGSLNDPKLEFDGFSSYTHIHETYALTKLIFFIMTGKYRMEKDINSSLHQFVIKGISDNYKDRYQNVNELQENFSLLTKELSIK